MANQSYEIQVKGHFSRDWADWLENREISLSGQADRNETVSYSE